LIEEVLEVAEKLRNMQQSKPQIESPKLLEIPVIPDSTGVAQHRAVVNLLEDWGILKNVIGLCSDTTASNTGSLKGSAKFQVQHLERRGK
jgi:hypothetical protein